MDPQYYLHSTSDVGQLIPEYSQIDIMFWPLHRVLIWGSCQTFTFTHSLVKCSPTVLPSFISLGHFPAWATRDPKAKSGRDAQVSCWVADIRCQANSVLLCSSFPKSTASRHEDQSLVKRTKVLKSCFSQTFIVFNVSSPDEDLMVCMHRLAPCCIFPHETRRFRMTEIWKNGQWCRSRPLCEWIWV